MGSISGCYFGGAVDLKIFHGGLGADILISHAGLKSRFSSRSGTVASAFTIDLSIAPSSSGRAGAAAQSPGGLV